MIAHKHKEYALLVMGFVLILVLIGLLMSLFGNLTYIESFRIVFGSIYVLFLPGFVLSFAFFPAREKSIDVIERIALSFALSIAVVPLVVFYLNLIGVKINLINSFFTILGIIIISLGFAIWRGRRY